MEAGRAMIPFPCILHLDGDLITNKWLPYLSSSCHDRFWLLNNCSSITVAHKGFIHEPKVLKHKAVDDGHNSNTATSGTSILMYRMTLDAANYLSAKCGDPISIPP
jgi:hypothetical protein